MDLLFSREVRHNDYSDQGSWTGLLFFSVYQQNMFVVCCSAKYVLDGFDSHISFFPVMIISGASEENIRDLFNKAYRTAPSIVFIDEIDAIASKRDNLQREMERRIVTQLMTCMDDYHKLVQPAEGKLEKESSDQKPRNILVIGATNRPDAIDSALRRPGRFDREIRLGVPDENARVEILLVLTKKCTLEGTVDLLQVARSTPGYVGADLEALVDKAGNLAMRRILGQRKSELSSVNEEHPDEWWKKPWSDEEIDKLAITMSDFEVITSHSCWGISK